MVALGTAAYTYEVDVGWGTLPDGWSYQECAAVGVDSNDNVYVFNRGEHPMIVFDAAGNFLRSWGEGTYPRAHGITVAPDDTLFCTDDGDHTVRKCRLDGSVIFTLGISGHPAPFMSGDPFNRCTHVAIDPNTAEFYVSDGYGNARVHKYTPDGKFVVSRGASRAPAPASFNIAPQHRHRQGRLGLRGRPGEPANSGVRQERQVRDPVEQHGPPLRPVHRHFGRAAGLRRRVGHSHRPQLPSLWPRPTHRHP